MTTLVLVYAFDCLMTVWVGTFLAGPPVRLERAPVCAVGWAGLWQPELVRWCTFLGADRCTVRTEE